MKLHASDPASLLCAPQHIEPNPSSCDALTRLPPNSAFYLVAWAIVAALMGVLLARRLKGTYLSHRGPMCNEEKGTQAGATTASGSSPFFMPPASAQFALQHSSQHTTASGIGSKLLLGPRHADALMCSMCSSNTEDTQPSADLSRMGSILAKAAKQPATQSQSIITERPRSSVLYRSTVLRGVSTVKVHDYPGSYAGYAAALSRQGLQYHQGLLAQASQHAYHMSAFCVRGCVQLIVFLSGPRAAGLNLAAAASWPPFAAFDAAEEDGPEVQSAPANVQQQLTEASTRHHAGSAASPPSEHAAEISRLTTRNDGLRHFPDSAFSYPDKPNSAPASSSSVVSAGAWHPGGRVSPHSFEGTRTTENSNPSFTWLLSHSSSMGQLFALPSQLVQDGLPVIKEGTQEHLLSTAHSIDQSGQQSMRAEAGPSAMGRVPGDSAASFVPAAPSEHGFTKMAHWLGMYSQGQAEGPAYPLAPLPIDSTAGTPAITGKSDAQQVALARRGRAQLTLAQHVLEAQAPPPVPPTVAISSVRPAVINAAAAAICPHVLHVSLSCNTSLISCGSVRALVLVAAGGAVLADATCLLSAADRADLEEDDASPSSSAATGTSPAKISCTIKLELPALPQAAAMAAVTEGASNPAAAALHLVLLPAEVPHGSRGAVLASDSLLLAQPGVVAELEQVWEEMAAVAHEMAADDEVQTNSRRSNTAASVWSSHFEPLLHDMGLLLQSSYQPLGDAGSVHAARSSSGIFPDVPGALTAHGPQCHALLRSTHTELVQFAEGHGLVATLALLQSLAPDAAAPDAAASPQLDLGHRVTDSASETILHHHAAPAGSDSYALSTGSAASPTWQTAQHQPSPGAQTESVITKGWISTEAVPAVAVSLVAALGVAVLAVLLRILVL